MLIVRFDKPVPEEQRDPNLREKLAAERDGILQWALTGLKRLMAHEYQFSETDSSRKELQQYRIDCNSALSFLNECCAIDAEAESSREEVFTAYREYCKKNGFLPMSQIKFNKDIEAWGGGIRRGIDRIGKRRTWEGLRLIAV